MDEIEEIDRSPMTHEKLEPKKSQAEDEAMLGTIIGGPKVKHLPGSR